MGGTVDEISKSLYARMYEDGGIAIDDVENILKANYDSFDDSDSAAIILNKAYRAAGFDAIDMPNPAKVFNFGPSGATHRVELDPSKVRVPSAMFDPRLKKFTKFNRICSIGNGNWLWCIARRRERRWQRTKVKAYHLINPDALPRAKHPMARRSLWFTSRMATK